MSQRENSPDDKSNGNIKGRIRPMITLTMKRQVKLIFVLDSYVETACTEIVLP